MVLFSCVWNVRRLQVHLDTTSASGGLSYTCNLYTVDHFINAINAS